MKATIMAIKEFLNTYHVFNMQDFKLAFPDSSADVNLLSRAVGNGRVKRVRQGLYVSAAERFAGVFPSPFDVGMKAVDDAVFCYHSALQLHGVLHNVVNRTQFYTRRRVPDFEYGGHRYFPLQLNEREVNAQSLLLPSGKSYLVTTREQTVVDCLYRVSSAGGPENVLRSLSGFTYLDADRAAELAVQMNRSTCARLGWVLEVQRSEWRIGDEVLDRLRKVIGHGPHYFYSSGASKDRYWSKGWKLYLPYPEKEMIAWLRT